jgi:hypothetical protein
MLLFGRQPTIKKNWESLVRKKYHLEIDREPFIAPSNIKKINLQ